MGYLKEYIIYLDVDFVCPLRVYRDKEFVCSDLEAMDKITFKDNCKGILTKRPDWCPLKQTQLYKGKETN